MRVLGCCVVALVLAGSAHAADTKPPEEFWQKFYADVEALQPPPQAYQEAWSNAAISEYLFEKFDEFRKAYENNEYIEITGFTIGVWPPGLSVDFGLK